VFASTATLEAIAAICADDDLRQSDVLYVLASLVEKSLVEAGEGQDGLPRYRMLQTVRAYAAERLTDRDEVRKRFVAYILELIEDIEPRLRGPEQVHYLSTMDAERDNIIAAVRIAVDQGDGERSARIAAGWTWYWMLRQGVFGESLSEQVMPIDRIVLLEADVPEDTKVMLRMLQMAGGTGDPDLTQVTGLLEMCGRVVWSRRYPLLAIIESAGNLLKGDVEAAGVAFRRALRHPDPWARATSVVTGALAAENAGDIDRAERWFTAAIRRFRRLGDRWGLMMALNGLAGVRSVRGDLTGANDGFVEALRIESELGPLPVPPMGCGRLGEIRYRAGDLDGALRDLDQSLVISLEQGQKAVAILALCRLSGVARARGDLDGARAYIQDARMHLAGRTDSPGDPMSPWVDIAEIPVLVAEGALTQARARAQSALTSIRRGFIVDFQTVAAIGEALADIAAAAGDRASAARLLGASASVRGALDIGSPDVRALYDTFTDIELDLFAQAGNMPKDEALKLFEEGASTPPDMEAPSSSHPIRRL
jgi:tetratricopeptide (TPR) repeat protein